MVRLRKFAAMATAAALFLSISYIVGWLLLPPRSSFGASWKLIRQEEPNSIDVLCVGSSLVYCDIIPAIVYEETGLTSYIISGPCLTAAQSYYYLKEGCRRQNPQLVCVELTSVFFGKYSDYTKNDIGYMPMSANRLAAAITAAEADKRLGLLFPLYNYHDRIFEFTADDIAFRTAHHEPDIYAGYTPLTDITPQNELSLRQIDISQEDYDFSIGYVKKIYDYCRDNDIALIFYTAPSCELIPGEQLSRLRSSVEGFGDAVNFWDCDDGTWPEPDMQTSWYDARHYNIIGAEVFSRAFAERISHFAVPSGDSSELWQSRIDAIYKIFDENGLNREVQK